ncbi:MAG TPA: hypothetical protein VH331_01205 [Allosphingosinicella sp.]|nr:hypothetical protein [Allosphingosinicella sp.]
MAWTRPPGRRLIASAISAIVVIPAASMTKRGPWAMKVLTEAARRKRRSSVRKLSSNKGCDRSRMMSRMLPSPSWTIFIRSRDAAARIRELARSRARVTAEMSA